jgi:cell division protein FtsN
MKQRQRGNTIIGLIVGLLLGLGLALGVAVYVTKVPVPFITKTQPGGAEQDEAEARRNRDWDPNAPLAGRAGQPAAPVAAPEAAQPDASGTPNPPPGAPVPVVVAPRTAPAPVEVQPPSSDPLGDLARARGVNSSPAASSDPFLYFVQAGAFRTREDAEAQRAKLSLMGVEVKVTEREQSGGTVFRVRAGPFDKKEEADRLKQRLDGGDVESALVRVQR